MVSVEKGVVSVEKGGILVTSFLWLWILSHGNVLLAFLRSFYLNYLHLCPESLPDVHLIRAHAASTWPAALLCFACIMQARKVRPCHTQQDAQKKHSVLLFIDIAAGLCQSHFLCDLYTRCLCLV